MKNSIVLGLIALALTGCAAHFQFDPSLKEAPQCHVMD